MRRREFITLMSGAAAWPLASQAARVARIGCLIPGTPQSHGPFISVFRQGLDQFGYEEGRDYVLDLRWAEGKVDRFPMLAEELALLAPDIIVAATSAAALAAKQTMATISIVCPFLTDPIRLGLVASHNRPAVEPV
jgi:putative tryptophan/tyrosine transport system substrate-binding protein